MHASYRPCQLQTYVDDIPQTHSGTEEIIVDDVVEQELHLVRLLEAEGLRVSPRGTLVASTPALARRVQSELQKVGIHLTVQDSARDVGADFAAGSRRRISIQKSRMIKVKAGVKVVLQIAGVNK